MDKGQVVEGRFSIHERVGTGGTGAVYRATDVATGATVAIKELHNLGNDGESRFARECAVLASLSDPGIVKYVAHGFGRGGASWLAMEWVSGPTLTQLLKRRGLSLNESLALGRRLACALGALHRLGIVHRDIKPSNVILEDADPLRPKLIDLGTARRVDGEDPLTATGIIVGTAGYLAPEQATGSTDIDARADVFALGCVLFRCIANRVAFMGDDPLTILLKVTLEDAPRASVFEPRTPESLDDLVARMLSRDRTARPADGVAVLAELDEIADSDCPPSLPNPTDQGAVTTSERRLVFLVVARHAEGLPLNEAEASALSETASLFATSAEILVDGTLVFVIDGVGAAGSAGDLARRAARAALAVKKAIPGARAVVATGRAVAGPGPFVGEAIERAGALLAVLEQHGSPGQVAVDQHAARLLADRFVLRARPDATLLIAEHAAACLGAGNLEAAFVGRERDLGYAKSLVDECFANCRARPILVLGAAGSGKSRLARELVGTLDPDRVEVFVASGDTLTAGTPFGMLAPLFFNLSGITRGEPAEVSFGKLESLVSEHVDAVDVERIADFMGELLGVHNPRAQSRALAAARRDAALMGDQMRCALAELLGGICRVRPVLLALEDVQWADHATLAFLDVVLRLLEAYPFCVLCLGRPELKLSFPTLFAERGVHEIRLEPLPRTAALRLARELAGRSAADSLLERIVDRADGNPFFLEELVRVSASDDEISLPGSVLSVLDARLDGLPTETRRVLRAASVLGKSFWDAGVKALLPGVDVRAHLAELERAAVVRRSPTSRFDDCSEWSFRNGLLADAAYARLPDIDRQRAHLAAARWLDSAGERDPTLLAEHYERGGNAPSAIALLATAAHLALEASDMPHAIALSRRAIQGGAAGEVLGELLADTAEAELWTGDNPEALVSGRAALEVLSPNSVGWCRAASAAIAAAGRANDEAALRQLIEAILAAGGAGDEHPERIVLLSQAAIRLIFAGNLPGADRLLDRIPHGLAHLGPADQGWLFRARGWRALSEGDPGAYKAFMRRSANSFRDVGDTRNACVQQMNEAYADMCLGRLAEAAEGLSAVLLTAERLGLGTVTATAQHNLGLVLARLGKLDEGESFERRAIESFVAQKDQRLLAASVGYLAEILLAKGALEAAEAAAQEAVDGAPERSPVRAMTLATLATVLLAKPTPGNVARAVAAGAEARELLHTIGGVDEGEGLIRLAHARSLAAAGHSEAAGVAAREAARRLHERAARITPAALRPGFLADVPEHAATFALAQALSE